MVKYKGKTEGEGERSELKETWQGRKHADKVWAAEMKLV